MEAQRALWTQIARNRNAYLFIAPFYVLFISFMLLPILFSLGLSMFRWNGIMAPRFVGLVHYIDALRDEHFHNAISNTAIFTALTVTISTVVGLALAIFLNRVRVLKRFYRSIFFIPAIISLVVVSLIWKLILNPEVGLVNELMRMGGAFIEGAGYEAPAWTHRQLHFLDHPSPIVPLLTITLVNVWAAVGFNTVIFLAGLQGIPAELYEVSRVDGATPFQNLHYITLPLLRPVTLFVVLISTIDALQVFVLPSIMNRDADSTMTVVYYLFKNAFQFYQMGYASAIAYILFALTVNIGLLIRRGIGWDRRWVAVD